MDDVMIKLRMRQVNRILELLQKEQNLIRKRKMLASEKVMAISEYADIQNSIAAQLLEDSGL